MIAVILCAGFATRMYPLTENFPKPLLSVAGKPVLDYLVDQIVELPRVEAIHIVSNAKFFNHFCRWRSAREASRPFGAMTVQIHNDQTTDNETRLGAAADLRFALNTIDRPDRVLVSAGDNIFRFPIKPLWEKFLRSRHHHIVALPETNRERLSETGVLELGEEDRVLRLHEKPKLPPTTWICPPLYFFQPSLWSQIDSFLRTSGNHDAPGYFIDYLCQREAVDAFRLNAARLDIGSLDSYQAADRQLKKNSVYTAFASE
jgi:glucose-1-phosphate thymidylyltransferase